MIAACTSLVKVLRTRKSVPASPVVPPLVPARPSFAAANLRRGKVPPHHRDTAELQLRRTPHDLDPEAAPHLRRDKPPRLRARARAHVLPVAGSPHLRHRPDEIPDRLRRFAERAKSETTDLAELGQPRLHRPHLARGRPVVLPVDLAGLAVVVRIDGVRAPLDPLRPLADLEVRAPVMGLADVDRLDVGEVQVPVLVPDLKVGDK